MLVSAEKFLKFAKLAASLRSDDKREYLKSVFIQVRTRRVFMVATNARFGAVQYLGNTDETDFCAMVTIDQYFLDQLTTEAMFGSQVIVTSEGVRTSFGFTYPGNPFVSCNENKNEFLTWPKWFEAGISDTNHGCMFLAVDEAQALIDCSPSGMIVFPQNIDTRKALIVKDLSDDNWIGVFVPWTRGGAALKFDKTPVWLDIEVVNQ